MEKDLPPLLDRETLLQLAPEQLVDIIAEQAIATSSRNKKKCTTINGTVPCESMTIEGELFLPCCQIPDFEGVVP